MALLAFKKCLKRCQCVSLKTARQLPNEAPVGTAPKNQKQ